jgi:hypothetical protein
MEVKADGSRRVAMQTLGWDQTGAAHKRYGTQQFEWYDLGPKDLIAIEVGVFYPAEGRKRFETEEWPAQYEALETPEPDEWERTQPFVIPNPPSGPWPKWDLLTIDPIAPIGLKTWVAAFEQSEKGFRQHYLGPVQGLRQKFTITDVRTGKVVNMGSDGRVFYGAVAGDQSHARPPQANLRSHPKGLKRKKKGAREAWFAIGRRRKHWREPHSAAGVLTIGAGLCASGGKHEFQRYDNQPPAPRPV